MDASPSLNAGSKAAVGPWPAVMAGLLAAAVGDGSSFAIVPQGLVRPRANPGPAAAGLVPGGTLGLAGVTLGGSLLPRLEWVTPAFTGSAVISIALPLFLVTMAAQNIPGLAVLRANGYQPPAGPLLVATGIATLVTAPFGGHTINLAAITAALCAGPDAHPDPKRRWIAGLAAGIAYLVLGLLSTSAMGFISAAPPLLIQAVAGLALVGAFGSSLGGFLAATAERDAAVITFVATASGFALFGIGSAFWGLVAGGAVLALHRARRKS